MYRCPTRMPGVQGMSQSSTTGMTWSGISEPSPTETSRSSPTTSNDAGISRGPTSSWPSRSTADAPRDVAIAAGSTSMRTVPRSIDETRTWRSAIEIWPSMPSSA